MGDNAKIVLGTDKIGMIKRRMQKSESGKFYFFDMDADSEQDAKEIGNDLLEELEAAIDGIEVSAAVTYNVYVDVAWGDDRLLDY